MRMPASAHGAWGIRMSHGAVPMEGIVPSVGYWRTILPCSLAFSHSLTRVFDTVGLMGRNVAALSRLREISAPTHVPHSVSHLKIKLDSDLVRADAQENCLQYRLVPIG